MNAAPVVGRFLAAPRAHGPRSTRVHSIGVIPVSLITRAQ
jgi:hypothetical protein